MPFHWRWLLFISLVNLRKPQFTLDLSTFSAEEYHDPLEFSRPDDQTPEMENLLELTRVWLVNEIDTVHDNTVEKNHFIQKGPHAVSQKRKSICLLTDKDICLEVDRTSTGNASLLHGGELEGDLCLSGTLDFTIILCLAQQRMRVYSELFIARLREEWQPGHKFNKMTMVILAVVDVITILAFIWRRVLTVENRTYQLTEKQPVERAAQLTNEKCDAVMKISHLNKKTGERAGHLMRLKIRVSSTKRKNRVLKALRIERNQRQGIKQKPEAMHQLHQQVETDLLRKMDRGWLDKIAKLVEHIQSREQLMKSNIEETDKDMENTEKLFETQMQGIEEQYKESLKLVSDLQRVNEERERRWKEEIAGKTKKYIEEGWLKNAF